jgi:phosphohistidine phosphatase
MTGTHGDVAASSAHVLYLLRHANSGWADPTLPDRERPLAPRGRRDAKRIAKYLRQLGCQPELVLCSAAARTRETLELLRPALGNSAVTLEEELYAASCDEVRLAFVSCPTRSRR